MALVRVEVCGLRELEGRSEMTQTRRYLEEMFLLDRRRLNLRTMGEQVFCVKVERMARRLLKRFNIEVSWMTVSR